MQACKSLVFTLRVSELQAKIIVLLCFFSVAPMYGSVRPMSFGIFCDGFVRNLLIFAVYDTMVVTQIILDTEHRIRPASS